MSIRKMIALHPEGGDPDDPLSIAAHHAMFCAAMCTSCADACSAEDDDMRQCIRNSLDCADVCEAVTKIALRRTGDNAQLVRTMLEACIRACEACADECERHDHGHCRLCAQMCRECAEDCRRALQADREPS
jgi:hypothetical protein